MDVSVLQEQQMTGREMEKAACRSQRLRAETQPQVIKLNSEVFYIAMGNGATSGQMPSPYRKLSSCHKEDREDKIKLVDLLAKHEDDIWSVPKHGYVSNKLQNMSQNTPIRYVHLPSLKPTDSV
ncbi:hypothetical protein UPYG_G00151840 [Umbra pygmaea]|uniref:Uncharacterized protein n=1 Tax=Umbra pygmaea TaxID=75934 RepID=A0ABD0X1A2_UMBPY